MSSRPVGSFPLQLAGHADPIWTCEISFFSSGLDFSPNNVFSAHMVVQWVGGCPLWIMQCSCAGIFSSSTEHAFFFQIISQFFSLEHCLVVCGDEHLRISANSTTIEPLHRQRQIQLFRASRRPLLRQSSTCHPSNLLVSAEVNEKKNLLVSEMRRRVY
jgi:hypothetical protein